jgi:hypothetical protein
MDEFKQIRIKMSSPIIHINRRFHVELESIISVTMKPWGRIWVKFIDKTTKKHKIAITKQEIINFMLVINTSRLMRGLKPLEAIIEK